VENHKSSAAGHMRVTRILIPTFLKMDDPEKKVSIPSNGSHAFWYRFRCLLD